MAARRFLWVIAIIVMLVLVAGIAWSLFNQQIMRAALVPTESFEESPKAPDPVYGNTGGWLAHPDLPQNPARWTPEGYQPAPMPGAAAFYITPTAYLSRDRWNAPFDDPQTNERLGLFLRSQATIFNGIAAIWSPRYRQATFGAFLTTQKDAERALDFAYTDVARAFDAFVEANPAGPIILGGHSQGSLHLLRLLREKVAGQPIAKRVVAAYAVGWPVSATADLPALGLPACGAAGQAGCILSWQSFAEPADPKQILEVYDRTPGYAGTPRQGTPMVCTNPITGAAGGKAATEANLGALVPSEDLASATLEPRRVPARCDERGFLLIGAPPEGFGRYVLPGNNYHVYDYPLFWANLRADAEARLSGWAAANGPR
jgi:hypothetical protein